MAGAVTADKPSIGGWLKDNRTMVFAIGLFGVFGIILIPLPNFILDFLLITNITFAILILMASIFAEKPLSLSTFPTVLLVATFFRLALNIATTRSILSNGGSARGGGDISEVAGGVIATFGDVVTGASASGANPMVGIVVGFIIFLIIVLVQFLVVTKGATRIAEVAARFTLDSMPGKQLAIDADLNAGIIDDNQARTRREEVSQEADFYGAMDGASKFVRGDAIAGIIITVINIIGGLVVGLAILEPTLSFSAAAQLYTMLTIGDGLVSQVPAFLISISAAIIVSRSSSRNALGDDITDQFILSPRPLLIAGLILFLLIVGLGGSMPTTPLLLLGSAAIYGWWRLSRKEKVTETKVQAAKIKEEKQKAKAPEQVEALLSVDPMEAHVGYGLIKLVDSSQGGDLLER
ncbi:MAG: flagellar biosynthesis protein FlhA, partial [Planctomycetes bacterium]|nr:flagellar biosynthesis protein FlhA [Planctomycetota bacterium]